MRYTVKNECNCLKCVNACKHRVGWFTPDQIPILARNMNMTIAKLFNKYLAIDFWAASPNIYNIAPANEYNLPGSKYGFNPIGKCIFLKNDLCEIHNKGKPNTCAFFRHDIDDESIQENHEKVAFAWKDHQQLVKDISGLEF